MFTKINATCAHFKNIYLDERVNEFSQNQKSPVECKKELARSRIVEFPSFFYFVTIQKPCVLNTTKYAIVFQARRVCFPLFLFSAFVQ